MSGHKVGVKTSEVTFLSTLNATMGCKHNQNCKTSECVYSGLCAAGDVRHIGPVKSRHVSGFYCALVAREVLLCFNVPGAMLSHWGLMSKAVFPSTVMQFCVIHTSTLPPQDTGNTL